jgi:hypothetical protein
VEIEKGFGAGVSIPVPIGCKGVPNARYQVLEDIRYHYYILCLFAKGQTKNLKGLRSKNNLPYLQCDTHRNLCITTHR